MSFKGLQNEKCNNIFSIVINTQKNVYSYEFTSVSII